MNGNLYNVGNSVKYETDFTQTATVCKVLLERFSTAYTVVKLLLK